MRIRPIHLTVALLAATFCALGVNAEPPEGFKALFNGKNLEGWSGDENLWSVEDGVIVGSTHGNKIEKNSFLSTKKKYGDFVLLVSVKLENHNSGVQFRSEQHPGHVVKGYQADVAEKTYFGMLYEEGKRGFMPYWGELSDEEKAAVPKNAKQGEWNTYEITCEGDHIVMKLNGGITCDIEDPEGAKEGVIALQLHAGDPMRVMFKDIYIKKLEK